MKDSFITRNGWKHWFVLIYIGYCVLFWGMSEYGFKTVEFPTSMVHSFAMLSLVGKLLLGFVAGFLINLAYEFLALIFARVSVDLIDCVWAGIGFVFGVLIFEIAPSNKYIFYITFGQLVALFAIIISIGVKKARKYK